MPDVFRVEGKRRFLAVFCFCLGAGVSFGQRKTDANLPPSPEVVAAVKEGRALANELLGQRPESDSINFGVLTIHPAGGSRRIIPLRVEVSITPSNWLNIYKTSPSTNSPESVKLTIVHTPGLPNQYYLANGGPRMDATIVSRRLEGNQTMVPFAGSDFWVCDLGLDFLFWPEQRVLKYETRRSQQCSVLQSTNPNPAPGCYSRVLCWLQVESPHGIVHAEAYDGRNQLMKQFDPKTLEKVHGQYQPEKLEIRNRQTGSRTFIEYNLER